MEKMKEVKIKVSEQEFRALSEVLLNKATVSVTEGYIIGNFLQKIFMAFKKEEEKEVEKNGKD